MLKKYALLFTALMGFQLAACATSNQPKTTTHWTADKKYRVYDIYNTYNKNERAPYAAAIANKDLKWTNDLGRSALHIAVSISDIEAVKMLLSQGEDPNRNDRRGTVPLQMFGSYRGSREYDKSGKYYPDQDVEIARMLIDAGANVNHKSEFHTVLESVVIDGNNIPVILALLGAGADPNAGGFPILCFAQSLRTFKLLMYSNASQSNVADCFAKNDKEKEHYKKPIREFMGYPEIKGMAFDPKPKTDSNPNDLKPGLYMYVRKSRFSVFTTGPKVPDTFEIHYAFINIEDPMSKDKAINSLVPAKAKEDGVMRYFMGEDLRFCLSKKKCYEDIQKLSDEHIKKKENWQIYEH